MGLLVVVGGSGCMPGGPLGACSLIGYSSAVEILLKGSDSAKVERLALCTERGCSVPGSEATPIPTDGPLPLYTISELGSERWRVEFVTNPPDEATIEVFAEDGTTLGQTTTQLEWRRVGGSEECGGPQKADPIVVNVG